MSIYNMQDLVSNKYYKGNKKKSINQGAYKVG